MDNREERKRQAKLHNLFIEDRYSDEVKNSVESSKIYREDFKGATERVTVENQEIIFSNLDTVNAIFDVKDSGKLMVLNFASYKYPGGGYLGGSKAQEECLCHASDLYQILSMFETDYYELNRKSLNKALYFNRAIYTPDVLFFRGLEKKYADVLYCAGPNKGVAQQYAKVSDEENSIELKRRVSFILSIAENEKVDILILGAYGCGVFRQDPSEVADMFLNELSKSKRFKKVIFAVPGADINAKVFKEKIGGYNGSKG